MRKPNILLSLSILMSIHLSAQQKCNCEASFKWVKANFEQNDAGFQYVIDKKGQAAYDKHNAIFLQKIKKITTNEACADTLNEWLHFFRKAHLYVVDNSSANNAATANGNSVWPTLPVSEDGLKQQLQNETQPSLQGIWVTGVYTIGIVKNGNGYKGSILNAPGSKWQKNQVKLEIKSDSSGVYFMGDYSGLKFTKAKMIGKNGLQLGAINLNRIYPIFQEDAATALYAKSYAASNTFLQELSAETILLRIPSFEASQGAIIDSLITVNKNLLSTKKNLVIDIRNNGGGDDASYEKIIPYLYTNPIREMGVELYSTPQNNKRMADYLSIPNLSDKSKDYVNNALKILNSHLGQFVNLDEKPLTVITLDSVLPNPQYVAIIINENNGSTAEQFLLAAKESSKVKLFGVTTMGVLDFSNMYSVESPDKQLKLGYTLSKSLRLPDMGIDNIGIQPDYFIDKSIPNEQWLNFVVETMKGW